MKTFTHTLWGYSLSYPDSWHHHSFGDTEGFAAIPQALDPDYQGEQSGHILIKTEWNSRQIDAGVFWQEHIALTAGILGAKKVNAVPWRLGSMTGIEADILLPRKENKRLWTGILGRDFLIFTFMVVHPPEEREWFEPAATNIISSLSFPNTTGPACFTAEGLPLPDKYTPFNPQDIVPDIQNPVDWSGYGGSCSIGALQQYYLREAPASGWAFQEFLPFPSESGLGFARFRLVKDDQTLTVGVMPVGDETVDAKSAGMLLIKKS